MIYELKVHESADLFPMLSNDELQEMADDIKDNGQIHPVVTGDSDGGVVLIDGRNRLAACKIAGIEPKVMHFEGDINTFINSANNVRRELTKGQKAMSYAVMFPEKSRAGRGNKLFSEKTINQPSRVMLSQARTILKYSPDLKIAVLSKTIGLNAAYDIATKAKFIKEEKDKEVREKADNMVYLENEYPKLYEQICNEKLTVSEALEEVEQLKRIEIAGIKLTLESYTAIVMHGMMLKGDNSVKELMRCIEIGDRENYFTFTMGRSEVVGILTSMNETLPKLIQELEK